jgi:phage terminase small subunit
MAGLTAKQQRFVEEYLIDLNATQAAIRAGYSEKTAYSQGQRLLNNVEIQKAVAEAQEDRSNRTKITADRVLQELARIGFSDLRNMLTDGIEVVTNTGERGKDEDGRKIVEHTHKIKVWDKNSALEKLGKHLGMFTEKIEHSGGVSVNVVDYAKATNG